MDAFFRSSSFKMCSISVCFNVGVETGQMAFVLLILLLEQSFRVLKVRWPRYVKALPGYTLGSLGAYWTVQRVGVHLWGAR
jgi:hypothetical protein